jgi:ubiquinone/menaquinone biosynthesis C-methylase UbiE/uncharacterized protein YbaR (Trm112 family)
MVSAFLLRVVRCPACRGALSSCDSAEAGESRPAASLLCGNCGASYPQHDPEVLDLRPRTAFREQTRYLEEALHADARHETVSPPLLQAGVRQRQLRRFLGLGPGDRVIDLGCGSGRSIIWNADTGAAFVGVDVSPHFAREARATADLALADLRQLPFGERTFSKGYALDVLEHLSPEALDAMLREAARVIEPGGALFVYSHVRKNAAIAQGLRAINALARRLERLRLIDLSQERLRKSDHLNPLADVPHLQQVARRAGFRLAKIRYYTPLVGGFLENILVRVAERALVRRSTRQRIPALDSSAPPSGAGAHAPSTSDAIRMARTTAKRRIARRGLLFRGLQAITGIMQVDLWLFGRVRSGPFFALLIRE